MSIPITITPALRTGFLASTRRWKATPVSVYETNFDEQGNYLDDIFPTEPKVPHPAAMVAFNDVIAWDVICRMQSRGLLYPKNLSMIGFDNLHIYTFPCPFPSRLSVPPKSPYPARQWNGF